MVCDDTGRGVSSSLQDTKKSYNNSKSIRMALYLTMKETKIEYDQYKI